MSAFEVGSWVGVYNSMQRGYHYEIVAERGAPTDNFYPVLTPNEMLRLGVFNGHYMTDCAQDYPREMFAGAKFSATPDVNMNLFKAKSGDSLGAWRARGWIHEQDPRGWFEWYCRYWLGRRTQDDYRQMARWRLFAPRHAGAVKAFGKRDVTLRRATRQALLHWSHDPMPDIYPRTGQTIGEKVFDIMGEVSL